MFDPKCFELAQSFMNDHTKDAPEEVIAALAQEIQDAIEGFIAQYEREKS